MRFSRDRRGQSVVVGTVILFGFLIVALGVYQVQVVPTDNANVEFEHSQQVEDDFGDLRNDVLRAGSTGSTGSTQVRLGTRYPARTFFVNPPPVSGSLETEETGSIRVRNATVGPGAHENAREFWNTSPAFPTSSLRYDADYNEFDGAPELVYEHSVVAAEFDDAVLLRSGQTVVSEERISLTALTGSVSESGVEPRSVDPRAVSASDTTIPLEPSGGNITLQLPTAVGNESADALADRWTEALPAGATATPNATGEAINVTLANGSDPYRLALSEVSLDATGETEPAYVVPVESETAAVGETVGVEVRDRYNNPVPDATVIFEGTTDGINITDETNDDGRAYLNANTNGLLNASINGTAGPDYESLSFDVSEGREGTTGNRTYDVSWDLSSILLDINTPEPATGSVDVDGDPLDNATVDFATTDPSVVEVASTSTRTSQGNFNEMLIPRGVGEATVFAASGDGVDSIDINVSDDPNRGDTEINVRIDDLSHLNENRGQFLTSFEVVNAGPNFERVEVEYDYLSGGGGGQTDSIADTRGRSEYTSGGTAGGEFDITLTAIGTDGSGGEFPIASRTITTTADANNPVEDDLGTGGSSFESVTFDDRSNPGQGPRYRIDYTVNAASGFDRVEGYMVSVSPDTGGRDEGQNTATSDRIDLNTYGLNSEFKLVTLVVDNDGVVVDAEITRDDADGSDPN